MSHETLRDTVNISSMTAGRYKARKRFTVQIIQAAGKKTKGILLRCRSTVVVKLTSSDEKRGK